MGEEMQLQDVRDRLDNLEQNVEQQVSAQVQEKVQNLVQETNKYTSEKTTAQAFLNTGLFTANATNLANLYSASERDDIAPERIYALKVMLIISMVLQVITFGLLMYVYTQTLEATGIHNKVKYVNSAATFVVGLITLLNIIITAFGTSAPTADPTPTSAPVA
jgi:hypothetical protein